MEEEEKEGSEDCGKGPDIVGEKGGGCTGVGERLRPKNEQIRVSLTVERESGDCGCGGVGGARVRLRVGKKEKRMWEDGEKANSRRWCQVKVVDKEGVLASGHPKDPDVLV